METPLVLSFYSENANPFYTSYKGWKPSQGVILFPPIRSFYTSYKGWKRGSICS